MPIQASLTAAPDTIITESEHLEVHESESVNFLRSGKQWYGEKFSKSGSSVTTIMTLPHTKDHYPATLTIKTKGGTDGEKPVVYHYFGLYLNSNPTATSNWSCSNYGGISKIIVADLEPGVIC
jgi:hypothetical protein